LSFTDAAVSVRQIPSAPPASVAPLAAAVNAVLFVLALMPNALPAKPISRDVIVNTAPSARAHTPVDPALINNSKHLATLSAVSPIRLRCAIDVGPRNTWVCLPNSGAPENVIAPLA
jgi:hypothetical protein